MKIVVRECEIDDYRDIALLNKTEMGYEYSEEDTKIKISKLISDCNHKIYVALVKEKVVGYVHANNYDLLYAQHLKNIMGIAVLSDFRNQGIGKLLLCEVERWAKNTGAHGIRLLSGASRIGAHKFYKACGYEENKDKKNFTKYF